MQIKRLNGRKINDFLRRKGKVFKGKTMVIKYLYGKPKNKAVEGLYMGTYASTKLHKSAVKRNRMRRRVREALRKTIKEINKLPTAQLLITPRSSSLTCDFSDIQKDVDAFLTTLTP